MPSPPMFPRNESPTKHSTIIRDDITLRFRALELRAHTDRLVDGILSSLDPRALQKRRFCESAEQEDEKVSKVPLWTNGLTFHHLGLIISATFGALAVAIAFFLVWRHASHYSKPNEQKHIIRILVMIPIYAVVSFLSYLNYHHSIYYEVIRDCYEAFAIASFFTLMCHYIAPNLHEQKQYFRNIEPKNWVLPINWMQKCTGGERRGPFRKPQSGLTWFNIVWVSVFQYCFIRVFMTIVSVITQAFDVYCQSSKDPRYAYIWVAASEAISVSIAMYCLVQFYIQLKQDLAPHKPFLKILCIKLVIFFCFWQSWIISLLTTDSGPLKASDKMGGPDWRIGLPAILVCVEMFIFAIMHLFAFPWKPYDLKNQFLTSEDAPKAYVHGPFRAIVSVFNPWDFVKAFGRGMRWLFYGSRHRKQDISYQTKLEAVSPATAYAGPTFAGNGDAATELTDSRTSGANNGSADSDTVSLLTHSQANPYESQAPYQAQSHGPSRLNPDSLPTAPTPSQGRQEYGVVKPFSDFEHQDTSYQGSRPAAGGLAEQASPPQYYREETGRPSTDWDMFAGARPNAQQANTNAYQGAKPPGPPPPGMI